MDIVVCTDNNYVMPTGVMFYSICKNNQNEEIRFHVIVDDSVTEDSRSSLTETITTGFCNKSIKFYLINGEVISKFPRLDETNTKKYITKATYYRLYLTEILPNNLDKVLYLDVDMIVQGSLTELWNLEIGDKSIGVIPDPGEGLLDKYYRLRYPQIYGYFNAGVLLINLKKWREIDALTCFMKFIDEHPDWIKLHDQDVLNRIFYNDKFLIPIKYNFQEGYLFQFPSYDFWRYEKEIIEARNHPIIIHYTDRKPWKDECRHPMREVFLNYKKESLWKNTPLLKFKLRDKMLKELKSNVKRLFVSLGIMPESSLGRYVNINYTTK